MNIFKKSLLVAAPLWLTLTAGAIAQVNITMWQVDYSHTGNNPNELFLTPTNVGTPGQFGQMFTQPLDGYSFGQPLYVSNLTIGGVTHNVVYVCTEHDSIYAFDADSNSGNNANPLWKDSMIPNNSVPVPQGDVGSTDIPTELGLTTTPVIDLSTSTIYIVSKVKTMTARTDNTGSYAAGTYQQYLHALDLTTGAEKFGGPVFINPVFQGSSDIVANGVHERVAKGVNGATVDANHVPFNALQEHTRAAMSLYNGIVYISYASHSDTDPYHGLIIGFDASNLQLNRWFISTPNGDKAGIWGGGAGPCFDSNGTMYISTGNGNFDQNASAATPFTDWGESVVKLPTTGTGQFSASYSDHGLSYFTPYNQAGLGDDDLGGGGILLLPDQTGPHPHLLVTGGKHRLLYVIDRDTMSFVGTSGNPAANSGYNGATDNVLQIISEPNQMFMTPGYFNGNLYYSSGGGPFRQWAVGYNATTGNYLNNEISSNDSDGVKGTGAFISSKGLTNGIVWTCDGNLNAYNASNITTHIFSGAITGGSTKFSLPIVANGKAYVAGQTTLNVYGLLTVATSPPSAPTGLTALTATSSQINLSWTDNSSNESGFEVYRSSSLNGTYSIITTTGPNTTTYSDANLASKSTYYYKVDALNSAGNSSFTNIASATTFNVFTSPGLVAYWPLDEATGTVVNDVTGHNHTGTLNGESEWVTGYINTCVNFHGTGSSPSNVIVPPSTAFQFTAAQSFTLSAWVNAAALRSSDETIVAESESQVNPTNGYGIYINSANKWVFRGPQGDLVGPAVTQGTWTHVAGVQDGVLGTRKLYVNGVLAATGAAQAANGTGDFWIGQQVKDASQVENQNNNATNSFPGQIDEVRLYNIPVTPGQITSLLGPPVLLATSNVTQGAGIYALQIQPATNTVIETRKGSTSGTYSIVLTFSAPVAGLSASLAHQDGTTAVGSVGTIAYSVGNTVATIPLTGVGNAQLLNLHVSSISPGPGTVDIPFDVLWGDVNADGQFDSTDTGLITGSINAPVTSANYAYDVNCDGTITSADTTAGTTGSFVSLGFNTNVALTGTPSATSTENATTEPASAAIDNNQTTRWTAATGYPQSWQIDLGSSLTITKTNIYWYAPGGRIYQYNIAVSNDPAFGTFTTPVNHANTLTGLVTDSFNATGRYLKLNVPSSNAGQASAYEIQIFSPGVGSAPVIATQPVSQALTTGQLASFSVGISGNSPATYQWMRNGQAIYGATSSTFAIPSASTPNTGSNYSVVVTNAYGSTTSNAFNITVSAPTLPSDSPSDTPTLPQWALIMMGLLMLLVGQRFIPRNGDRATSA